MNAKLQTLSLVLHFAFVTSCCTSQLAAEPVRATESQKPNIVFILADDLGYRELGCYGQQKITTPNIDRLAAQGMRFTQHYAGNAVCAPSRCVLMTGKHPGHAFVRNNRETKPEGQWPIPDAEVTMLERFQELGYTTGTFGKWGLGGPESSGRPLAQGVDRFYGYNCQAHAHSYYPDYLWSDEQRVELNNSPPIPGHASLAEGADPSDPASYEAFKGNDYAADRIHDQALQFIRDNQEQPFFLYYPSTIPHVALHIPDQHLEPYLKLNWNDPPFIRARGYGYTPHFTPRAAYAAMISLLDQQVGEVVELLRELSPLDNTIIVFTSDNGTTHLKDEVDYEFFESVGELRGLKGSLYEGGIRVPMIASWSDKIAAGSTSARVSGFEDWLPTLLELCGSEGATTDIDGISFAPTLLGEKQPERPFLYREFPGYGGQQSIRHGDWKAIRQRMNQGNTEIELYNLADDPSESRNLANENEEMVRQLANFMSEARTPSEDFPLIPFDAPVKRNRRQ